MKDGYYWAKHPAKLDWEIVKVKNSKVYSGGIIYDLDDYEFGDKIEIPEKYES